jgi:hypothetical protein
MAPGASAKVGSNVRRRMDLARLEIATYPDGSAGRRVPHHVLGATVHVVRVSENCWLTLSESIEPAYMIIYGPAVHRSTGETHLIYKIVRHNLRKDDRWTVGWAETLAEAVEVCRRRLETPLFVAPARAPDGDVVTQDEQRERWVTGRDPRTGN